MEPVETGVLGVLGILTAVAILRWRVRKTYLETSHLLIWFAMAANAALWWYPLGLVYHRIVVPIAVGAAITFLVVGAILAISDDDPSDLIRGR